jgi:CDP-diacylglycerol--serine O-phosphatidyltransferase
MADQHGNSPTKRRRGIFLLPNLLTTGTLFAGFYGIIASVHGSYAAAAIAVFIAAVLDGLDGRLARLTNTESEFGKQYDSLADMVAFGIAPAVIVYQWGLGSLAEFGWAWGKLGWLGSFLYAVSAALRLARFNVMPKTADRRFFEGLPSPSAAALVVNMVWTAASLGWSGAPALALGFVVTVSAGLLMISKLAYYSFKDFSLRGRISFTYVLIIPLIFILIAIDPPTVLFGLAVLYALSAVVVAFWRRRHREQTRARRQEFPEDG